LTVRVTFLGAGDAFNAGARCHASYLVEGHRSRVLLDCGSTTLLALKRTGLSAEVVDAVMISHLHGDHFAGIPFLLLDCIYETPRRRPLTILGPPGTAARVGELQRTMYRELAARPLPFELRYLEVRPGTAVPVAGADVLPFRVPHQEREISLGLRLRIGGKTILYSGDTGWTENLVVQSADTDLFICECCFFETRVAFHLDYPRLSENHHRFGCRRLVLTHLGREVLERRDELEIELAWDGLVVEL
jgi:ribonuclease BN (tRNA processing enzyme)